MLLVSSVQDLQGTKDADATEEIQEQNKDENTGKIIATIQKDGNMETYECSFLLCDNPVCTCGSIEVGLTPLQGQNQKETDGEPRGLCALTRAPSR